MRRKDREVTSIEDIESIIKYCKVCRIGFYDGNEVYIVPMNFGYNLDDHQLTLYFHSAMDGRKAKLLLAGSQRVAIEMDAKHQLIEGERACQYSYSYQSLMGTGQTHVFDDEGDKTTALNHIMYQQTGQTFEFDGEMIARTLVFAVRVDHYSAKVYR